VILRRKLHKNNPSGYSR